MKIFPWVMMVFLFLSLACREKDANKVYAYLDNVEVQYETAYQKAEIYEALTDMLYLPPEVLSERLYSNYSGLENQWNIQTLLYKHFVPDQQYKTLGDNFFQDVQSKEVQRQIQRLLKTMEGSLEKEY